MPTNNATDPVLTIFTPAYNRAHTLPRTYESLCRQKCKQFVWLIIDDGSTILQNSLRDGRAVPTDFPSGISTKKMEACTQPITQLMPISIQS